MEGGARERGDEGRGNERQGSRAGGGLIQAWQVKLSLETVKKRQRELAEAVDHQVKHAHVQF